MVLGLNKSFVICLVIAVAIAVGSENAWNGVFIVGCYAISTIVWRILT